MSREVLDTHFLLWIVLDVARLVELLATHSAARRMPLCSVEREIRVHHPLIPRELRLAS